MGGSHAPFSCKKSSGGGLNFKLDGGGGLSRSTTEKQPEKNDFVKKKHDFLFFSLLLNI